MVDRVTGRVVHIDFGDCFEVAMQRDKFPEKVPFRLTRMLVSAMEVRESRHFVCVFCGKTLEVVFSCVDIVDTTEKPQYIGARISCSSP